MTTCSSVPWVRMTDWSWSIQTAAPRSVGLARCRRSVMSASSVCEKDARKHAPPAESNGRLWRADRPVGVGHSSVCSRLAAAVGVAACVPQLSHVGGRLGPPLEVELGEDRADVVLDGLVGQEDLGRDLLVRLALGDEEPGSSAPAGQLRRARRARSDVAIRRIRSRTLPVTAGSSSDSPRPTASSAATRSRARTCLRR